MDMNLSAEDIEFRDEVRAFLNENLTDSLRTGLGANSRRVRRTRHKSGLA